MSCSSPLQLNNGLLVPCGRCMCCRVARQSSLAFLAERELISNVYSKGLGASFLTLTYNQDSVPYKRCDSFLRQLDYFSGSHPDYYVSLYKKDVQDFFKRVRRSMDYHNIHIPFKYLSCGEYGGSTDRPHYHIVFLGLSDVVARDVTRKNWPYGLIDVGPLTSGGLRYVTKYCTKKYDSYNMTILQKSLGVEPPFLIRSQRIGYDWIDSHLDSIVSSDFTFIGRNGSRRLYPKDVRDYVSKKTGVDPFPSVQKFLYNDFKACPSDVDYDTFQRERVYLHEQYLRSAARSRGLPVTPEFLARKCWLRPSHSVCSPDVADFVKHDDVVPF